MNIPQEVLSLVAAQADFWHARVVARISDCPTEPPTDEDLVWFAEKMYAIALNNKNKKPHIILCTDMHHAMKAMWKNTSTQIDRSKLHSQHLACLLNGYVLPYIPHCAAGTVEDMYDLVELFEEIDKRNLNNAMAWVYEEGLYVCPPPKKAVFVNDTYTTYWDSGDSTTAAQTHEKFKSNKNRVEYTEVQSGTYYPQY